MSYCLKLALNNTRREHILFLLLTLGAGFSSCPFTKYKDGVQWALPFPYFFFIVAQLDEIHQESNWASLLPTLPGIKPRGHLSWH